MRSSILFFFSFLLTFAVASRIKPTTYQTGTADVYGECIAGRNGIAFHANAGCCRQLPLTAHLFIESVNGTQDLSYRTADGSLEACIHFGFLQSNVARVFVQTTDLPNTTNLSSIVIGVRDAVSFAYVQTRPDDVLGQDGTQAPYTLAYPVSSMYFDDTPINSWTTRPRSATQVAYGAEYADFNVRFCADLCIPDCTLDVC